MASHVAQFELEKLSTWFQTEAMVMRHRSKTYRRNLCDVEKVLEACRKGGKAKARSSIKDN